MQLSIDKIFKWPFFKLIIKLAMLVMDRKW